MKKRTALVGVLALMGCASLANADIQISYSISSVNGGAQTLCGTAASSTGPVTCSLSGSDITIEVLSASSNSPGTPDLAELFGSALFISTSAAVNGTIWISAQGFTAPTTTHIPYNYESSLSVTSTTGTGSVGMESCIDTSNGLAPPTGAYCSSPAATPLNATEGYSGGSSNSDTPKSQITSLTADPYYSLSEQITLDLGTGSNLNIITSQSLAPTPVPEPSSIMLLGATTLGLLAFMALRRNKVAGRS